MDGDTNTLGEFLYARRSRLRPEDIGYPRDERRRVRGLRREEVAYCAGVSVSYYTRLEQGTPVNVSASVLNTLANALQLDSFEREHLLRLAGHRPTTAAPDAAPAEHVDEATNELLDSFGTTPALVLGARTDVLAWNPMGHALLAPHLDPLSPGDPRARPNMARLVFLEESTRVLYADWYRKARAVVGNLRAVAGRRPHDAALATLVSELSLRSPDFAELWHQHDVRPCEASRYELRHPHVGPITVAQQVLVVAREPDQTVVVATVDRRDTASADALTLLERLTAGD
ncbi:helix-turn-helix transcriptional regulator [Nocardiopsis sp. CT-R113]|uniref:Helix-turn-helix transcriptional regulator n=1 Tax=Nocardiopsis codii TaxID=3065942 RepID=A0ABU7K436_9ACTN|nr:helix-turn-helix transcriptional regulator [Nocardiopsis sp. CT-R113]MEE2036954.1 helix-turn-helix transcriptional regulator [Nocardiopsis sp. CT-R113]